MNTSELLPDWPLLPFEVNGVRNGEKGLFICSKEMYEKTTSFYHTNGMTLSVLNKFKSSFGELSNDELNRFGVIPAVVSASCEHPEFHCYRYDNWSRSDCVTRHLALASYFKNNPNLKLDMETEYYFVSTQFYTFWQGPKIDRDSIDQERIDLPYKGSYARY